MDRLVYTAFSGMADSLVRQGAIASDLANAQTTGFRAERFDTVPVTLKGPALEVRAMAATGVLGADMSAGSVIQTGRPLDIAVDGDALIAVQAEDGSEAYTRRGDLSVSPAGALVNGDGRPVMGAGGPVTVPLGSDISVGQDGSILIADPENAGLPPQPLDRIKLAGWQGSPLVKGTDGLFRVPGGGVLPTDEAARVNPGALEQSNVDVTEILVEMVEAQRLFDMRTKLVSTAREIDESGAGLMRI